MTDTLGQQPATTRIAALDVIRGLAVMGILVANLPAFALPQASGEKYAAWGGHGPADRIVWAVTFVLIEGKMRGLFTLLFGASMLLVIDTARAAGRSGAATHFSRMAWLFLFGIAHLYLFWRGDILAHYALVGAIAFLFAELPVSGLLAVGTMLVGCQVLEGIGTTLAAFGSFPRTTPAQVETWNRLATVFGQPSPRAIAAEIATERGRFLVTVAHRWREAPDPWGSLIYGGGETLGTVLWGMAALRSGFLTGAWPRALYQRWAAMTLPPALAAYAIAAATTVAHGFDMRFVTLGSTVVGTMLRPLAFSGYAALAMLLIRPGGALTARLAAVGQAAFTNYLVTTLLMTALFSGWGLGLFGALGRAELYWLVPLVWMGMLAWSPAWLARYRQGPLEWLWRSLARRRWQPLRR